jgi:hypothetical protein
MKIDHYRNEVSLREFGIMALTSEACGLGMRVLCDLTEAGVQLIRDFLKVEPTSDNWNQGDPENPNVKSIMLPHILFRELWIFGHIKRGTKYVFLGGHVFHNEWTETKYESINEVHKHPVAAWKFDAFAIDDEETMAHIKSQIGQSFYVQRWYRRSQEPGNGIDNEHAMTGRMP